MMKLLLSFYRAAITKLQQLAWLFGIMNLERSLSMYFRLRQPVGPYRCMIKKQELAKWVELLYKMIDDGIYMMTVFTQLNQIQPMRPVKVTPGEMR